MDLPDETILYQINVMGRLSEKWADWLSDRIAQIQPEPDDPCQTTISALVPDQATLRGIINKLWDMNLTLISIKRSTKISLGDKHEN